MSIDSFDDFFRISNDPKLLKKYIRTRLKKKDITLSSIDDEPEYFIISAIKRSPEPDKIFAAIRELLEMEVIKIVTAKKYDSIYLSRLLYLIENFTENFKIRECYKAILIMSQKRDYYVGHPGYYTEDLYAHILRLMAHFQDGPPGLEAFWWHILQDSELKIYYKQALFGLRFCGFKTAIKGIRVFSEGIEINQELESKIQDLSIYISDVLTQSQEMPIRRIIESVFEETRFSDFYTRINIQDGFLKIPLINGNEEYVQLVKMFNPNEYCIDAHFGSYDFFNVVRDKYHQDIREMGIRDFNDCAKNTYKFRSRMVILNKL